MGPTSTSQFDYKLCKRVTLCKTGHILNLLNWALNYSNTYVYTISCKQSMNVLPVHKKRGIC